MCPKRKRHKCPINLVPSPGYSICPDGHFTFYDPISLFSYVSITFSRFRVLFAEKIIQMLNYQMVPKIDKKSYI